MVADTSMSGTSHYDGENALRWEPFMSVSLLSLTQWRRFPSNLTGIRGILFERPLSVYPRKISAVRAPIAQPYIQELV